MYGVGDRVARYITDNLCRGSDCQREHKQYGCRCDIDFTEALHAALDAAEY